MHHPPITPSPLYNTCRLVMISLGCIIHYSLCVYHYAGRRRWQGRTIEVLKQPWSGMDNSDNDYHFYTLDLVLSCGTCS